MKYPRLLIDKEVIKKNVEILVEKCKKSGIDVVGVTKGVCADKKVVDAFVEGGVSFLGDSRMENLITLRRYNIPKVLLRLPMISEADIVVKYTDISLNSELETILVLNEASAMAKKTHKVILMIDLGDLREGFFYEQGLFDIVEEVLKLENIKLEGIGTNLTCFAGVIPEDSSMIRLNNLARKIEDTYNIQLNIVSGGNSSTLYLLEDGKLDGINNLRLGESLLLGKETSFDRQIEDTSSKGFLLEVEIIEKKYKPSLPVGKIGRDAFGEIPTFIDKGLRKRIICAIGRQDVKIESLIPLDEKIIMLGASSDHLIIDSSESDIDYNVGNIIKFSLKYSGILSSMTSKYVKRKYLWYNINRSRWKNGLVYTFNGRKTKKECSACR